MEFSLHKAFLLSMLFGGLPNFFVGKEVRQLLHQTFLPFVAMKV